MTARAVTVSTLIVLAVAGTSADRRWRTGTWTRVGVKHTALVGDPVQERSLPPGVKPQMTQVATYVIETDDRKYSLQSLVGLGSDELDARVTVGTLVTFAIEKKTAYIKIDEREYRLLVTNDAKKTTPPGDAIP